MAFDFPYVHFPAWWDIHTHKGNHLCKIPVLRFPYGNGRCMVADWGRVGSCHLYVEEDEIKVLTQITCDLIDKIHFLGYPIPVLPPYYHLTKPTEYDSEPLLLGTPRDFSLENLINDPVFGRQASAAFLVTKLFGIMRRNLPTSKEKRPADVLSESSQTESFLNILDRCTQASLESGCNSDSLKPVLDEILKASALSRNESSPRKSYSPKKGILVSSSDRSRLSSSAKKFASFRDKLLPVKPALASVFSIPLTAESRAELEARLGLQTSNTEDNASRSDFEFYRSSGDQSTAPDFSRPLRNMASAVDPFLISLAGRRVNSAFLGNGCLRLTHSPSGNLQSPVLLWAPPLPSSLNSQAPSVYFSSIRNGFPLSSSSLKSFQFPDEFSSAVICELDALQLNESLIYVLARTASGKILTCNASFESSSLEESGDLNESFVLLSVDSVPVPSLLYKPASVAISPWKQFPTSLEWVVAGRRCSSLSLTPPCHMAAVELFDCEKNSGSWRGQIKLDLRGESFSSQSAATVLASSLETIDSTYKAATSIYPNHVIQSDLLNYCSQVHQRRNNECGHLSSEEILLRAELEFELNHSSTWLRVGFADSPGRLTLTTPKRLLALDSRLPSCSAVAQELFSLNSAHVNLDGARQFNPAENLFHAPPSFFGDVYAILGTDYNNLLLDKRMPGHPVLHWSHGLRAPLAFADWCQFNSRVSELPAQFFLVTGSQVPADLCVTGINFDNAVATSGTAPPQLVGPSRSGGFLTDLVSQVPKNLPQRLFSSELSETRFSVGLLGLASAPIYSKDKLSPRPLGIRALSLTSAGDIFSHEWYFDSNDNQYNNKSNVDATRNWCMEFHRRAKKRNRISNSSVCVSELFYPSSPDDEGTSMEGSSPPANTSQTPIHYPNVLSTMKDTDVTLKYSKELLADLELLWQPNSVVPTSLSDARLSEEKKRQEFLDGLISKASEFKDIEPSSEAITAHTDESSL